MKFLKEVQVSNHIVMRWIGNPEYKIESYYKYDKRRITLVVAFWRHYGD